MISIFVWSAVDLFSRDECRKFHGLFTTYKVDIRLFNVTNLHWYDSKNVLKENMQILLSNSREPIILYSRNSEENSGFLTSELSIGLKDYFSHWSDVLEGSALPFTPAPTPINATRSFPTRSHTSANPGRTSGTYLNSSPFLTEMDVREADKEVKEGTFILRTSYSSRARRLAFFLTFKAQGEKMCDHEPCELPSNMTLEEFINATITKKQKENVASGMPYKFSQIK